MNTASTSTTTFRLESDFTPELNTTFKSGRTLRCGSGVSSSFHNHYHSHETAAMTNSVGSLLTESVFGRLLPVSLLLALMWLMSFIILGWL